jgi:hypothetical protein
MDQTKCLVFVTKIPTTLPDSTKVDPHLCEGASGEGASGEGIINLNTFTTQSLMLPKTAMITLEEYERLKDMYLTQPKTQPCVNLVMFTIYNKNNYLEKDKHKLCCILLFKNSVYSYHYLCTIDTIEEKKQHIKHIITTGNMNITNYSTIKITFNEDGTFKDSNDELLF